MAEHEFVRVIVDKDGNVVDESDPAGAFVLSGDDAREALRRQSRAEKAEAEEAEEPMGGQQDNTLSERSFRRAGAKDSEGDSGSAAKSVKGPAEDKAAHAPERDKAQQEGQAVSEPAEQQPVEAPSPEGQERAG